MHRKNLDMSPNRTYQSGRILAPLIMVVLTLIFMGAVIYQATRTDEEAENSAQQAQTSSTKTTGTAGNTAKKDKEDSAKSEAAVAAEAPTDSEAKQIQDAILAFFARMPADVLNVDNPLAILQAREELQEYLDGLPPSAAPILIDILKEEADFVNRRFLLYALADMGTDIATDGLLDHYHRMAELDKESEVGHTIKALERVGSAHSFDVLIDLTERDGAIIHRDKFVRALGNHPDSREALPTFTRLMHEDRSFKTRLNSATAIKGTGDTASAIEVERALQTEKNNYVRQSLIGALGTLREVNSLGVLEEILQNDQHHVNRMSAVNAVGRIGGPEARRILEQVAAEDKNERVRFDAQRKLREMDANG